MHTPEYDESGRLVRTVVTHEPEFDEEQYAYMVALVEHELSTNEYGIPLDEATSPEADADNRKGAYKYQVVDVLDHARVAVEQWSDAHKDDPLRAARSLRVVRVERKPQKPRKRSTKAE